MFVVGFGSLTEIFFPSKDKVKVPLIGGVGKVTCKTSATAPSRFAVLTDGKTK